MTQLSFTEIYETLLVPAIFAPWGRDLIERARPIHASDRILDLGCGTGIVARLLRERLGGAARITGIDANGQMIAKARSIAPEIDYREANAMALPFEDGSFDVVLSQEMMQFVPDRAAAAREIRRLLARGGRLVLSVWRARDEQPLHEVACAVAERHLGTANDKRYSFGDAAALRELLVGAGFDDVCVETITHTERHPTYPARLNAMAMNFDLAGLADDERERRFAAIEAETATALARFVVDGGHQATTRANVAVATAGRS